MLNSVLDFLPSYPDISNPKLSYEILRRKEFYDIRLGPSENIPTTPDTPLDTQKIESRAFNSHTPYSGEIVFAEPGTGKTCTTEFIIDTFISSPLHKALIIAPSDTLFTNFITDIAKKCASLKFKVKFEGSKLEKKKKKAEENCKQKENKIACIEAQLKADETKQSLKGVKKAYDVQTFHELFTKVKDMKEDEIKTRFNHRVIFIDEAHLLRNDEKTKETYYDAILRLVDIAEGIRLFLLTGTPIWDKVEDLASLINLLLPREKRLKTGHAFTREYIKGTKINSNAVKELRAAFHGRISFLRTLSAAVDREFVGVTAPWLEHIKVYPVAMSGFQKEISETLALEEKGQNGRQVDSGFKVKSREASNFVAPDYKENSKSLTFNEKGGSAVPLYGSEFYKKAIKHDASGDYKYNNAEYLTHISENIGEYSNKLAFIAEYSETHPTEVMWVYNKSVKTGGGVINDSLILSALKTETGKKRFYWAKKLDDLRQPSNVPRFIVISSEPGTFNTPDSATKALEIVSSPENKYGKLCKIVFGSKRGALGLNIRNVRCSMIKFPHWNFSEIDQALARALRFGSYANFEDEKEKYLKVLLLASVKEFDGKSGGVNKGKGFPKDVSFDKEETVDLTIYKTAEKKDYLSKQFYRLMKEGAWNCAANYGRNVLSTDVEGSRFADYTTVNYKCEGFPEEHIDKSGKVWKYNVPSNEIITANYNSFYSVDADIVTSLKELFRNYGCLQFQDIKRLVVVDELALLGTLKYMIEKNVEIKDRFGFTRYLDEDSDVYYLKATQTKSTFYDSYYVNYPIVNERLAMEDVVEYLQLEEDKLKVKKFCKSDDDDFVAFVNSLNYKTKVYLIEELAINNLEKAFELFPHNVFQSEHFVWHNLYQIESKGIKYAKKPIAFVRILENGKWRFIQKGWELDQLSAVQSKAKPLPFNEELSSKLGVFATIDTVGFKIKDTTKPKDTSGTLCAYISKDTMFSWIWSFHQKGTDILETKFSIPSVSKLYESKGGEAIKTALKGKVAQGSDVLYGGDEANLNKLSDQTLVAMLSLVNSKKPKICEFLEGWFMKNGLVKVKA